MNESMLYEFLQLNDFEEYMEKYSRFCGLKMGSATFRKELELMERDDFYTHREKEAIREHKKRAIVKELHEQIDILLEEINQEGIWRLPIDIQESVEIQYVFPNDRRGDIAHYIAGLNHNPEGIGDNVFKVTFSGDEYQLIELMILSEKSLFTQDELGWESPGALFLLRYNRIAQIERLMAKVNYYKQEYRSIRTIPNMALKALLLEYHTNLKEKCDEIYEYLIGTGATNPRWKSEQKAFAIIKEHYPDAKFQYQPKFLYGQRLDIYIPSKKTAIEYQGKQHYEPVDFFGGNAGYKSNVKRDARKRARCNANGITVLYWDYDKPVTDEYFQSEIEPLFQNLPSRKIIAEDMLSNTL